MEVRLKWPKADARSAGLNKMLKCRGMGKVRSGLKVQGYRDGGAATKKKFPDLNKDGKVTRADVLKGRGVPGFKDGGDASKDACYRKVKARYKVFPSAYASGAIAKCRKVGAKNWGNKSRGSS